MLKKKISENEMILEFLKAELDSSRFRKDIDEQLNKLNQDISIVTDANLEDSKENKIRKELFKLYRDYENPDGLFEGFPNDVEWFEEEISKEDLLNNIYYIDYSYWNEISNGTRLAKNAVENINNDIKIFNVPNDGFRSASEDFRKGKSFTKLILVSDGNKLVVLEGHLRITVYAMNPTLLTDSIPVIIGYSEKMKNWTCF
jgi:hypothetical protein